MVNYQLYEKKNREVGTKVAECFAKNIVDAKVQFENNGYGGAYFIGSYTLSAPIPVVLKNVK